MTPIVMRPTSRARAARVTIPLFAVALALLLVRASDGKPELASSRPLFLGVAIVSLPLLIWGAAAWRRRLVVDAEGVTLVAAFFTRKLRWSEVTSVEQGWFLRSIGGEIAGRATRIRFDGTSGQVQRVVDTVLANAPRLRALGWGLGLVGDESLGIASGAAPRIDAADLPDRLQLFDTTLEIHGPRTTFVRIDDELPDHAERLVFARERLARLIVGD